MGLERQELLPEGNWSEWTLLSRSRIDQDKRLFDIKDTIDVLGEGGMDVQLLLFSSTQVQASLLQPTSYQIASAEDSWYPPSIYPEFRKQQDEILENERKQAKEEKQREKESRESSDPLKRPTTYGPGARGTAGTTRAIPGVPGRGVQGTGRGDEMYPYSGRPNTGRPKTLVDVDAEFAKLQLNERTKYEKLKEPLTFWAFDDTVVPGKNYRYRIRLGVFNKVAGTNQLKESFASLRNHVILWSDYSKVTDVVSVPKRFFVFPTEAQISPKTVKIQISKYILGYWYSKRFTVKPGEAIGTKVAYEPEVPVDKTTMQPEVIKVSTPETIDYSTGAVLLDVMAINEWVGAAGDNKLDSRQFFDMLYTYDGTNLERDPISSGYWAKDLLSNYNEIKKLEKRERKEFQAWGGGQKAPTGLLQRTPRGDEGGGIFSGRVDEDN
ncbi:MAG: hypothetical protein E4H44_03910 [Candidatus Aminicenantes bacterium]|nr:MAG: hypothetical protein E4H44_03910 [Candidatus Aminicenantes bacterium]